MNSFKKRLFVLICSLSWSVLSAQTHSLAMPVILNDTTSVDDVKIKLTVNDEGIIRQKAEMMVSRFMHLLNMIATGLDLEVSEVEKIIQDSYSPANSRIFYNSDVIIADDLRKVEDPGLAKEKTAWNYLRDFELFYRKSENSSVVFSNFKVSEIRQGTYMYVKVIYDCLFQNKTKISDEPFHPQKRIAELRIEKSDNKWRTWIVDVDFFDSSHVNDMNKMVSVTGETMDQTTGAMDHVDSAGLVSLPEKDLNEEERASLRRKNDSVRTYLAYKQLVDSGKHAMNQGNNILAYQYFNEAETVNRISPHIISGNDIEFLQTMIRETRKNIEVSHQTPDQLFSSHINEAALFLKQRKYSQALEEYNKALLIRGGDEFAAAKRKDLISIINNLTRLETKYVSGNYKEAIKEYEKLIRDDSRNADYYLGRGKCYEKVKELKKALKDFNRAVELEPTWIDALKQRASVHVQLKLYAEAVASYVLCTVIDEKDVNSYLKIAELNVLLNKTPEAIKVLDGAIGKNRNSAPLFQRRAELFYLLKQHDAAINDFNTVIGLDSLQPVYYFGRGLSYYSLHKLTAAASDFVRARQSGSDNKIISSIEKMGSDHFSKALLLYNSGYLDSALKSLEFSIRIDPDKPAYYLQRGILYYHNTEYKSAVTDFSNALSLDQMNSKAYTFRGLSYFRIGKHQEAVGDFKKAIGLDRNRPELYKFLGDALLSVKEVPSSITSYNTAVEISKGRKAELSDSLLVRLYRGRGEAYYQSAKFENAISDFANTVRSKFSQGIDFYNYGKTLIRLKQWDKAIENLQKSLTYENNNPEWNYTLAEVYFQRGQYEKALSFYSVSISGDLKTDVYAQSIYGRARCYVKTKEYSKALNDFRSVKSENVHVEFPSYYTDLGYLFLDINQADSALYYFDRSAISSPDVMVYFGKAISLAQLNKPDEALVWLEKTLVMKKLKKSTVTGEPGLASIRENRTYRQLIKKYY